MAEQRRITCFFTSSSEASSSASVNVSETDSVLEPEQLQKRPRLAVDHRRRSGFDHSWRKKQMWLTYNEESGMLCSEYNMMPRNGTGKWVTVGCTAFRHDKVLAHENPTMHKEAERAKVDEARAAVSGGIRAALEDTISHERRVVIGDLFSSIE